MPSPSNKNNKPRKSSFSNSNFMRYSSLGFQMVAAILVGVFGGMQLDKWLNTSPVLTIVCIIVGLAAGVYIAIKDFV